MEYKFRGIDAQSGEWRFGDLVHREDGRVYIFTNETWYEVIPSTVGMWTGLKDKNGVEIYEGDKLKCDFVFESWWFYKNALPTGRDGYSSVTGYCFVDRNCYAKKIWFEEKNFWWDNYPDLTEKIQKHLTGKIIRYEKSEIIGNIHQTETI